jgi:hypothetical protein
MTSKQSPYSNRVGRERVRQAGARTLRDTVVPEAQYSHMTTRMRAIGRARKWTGHRTRFPRSEEVISDAMGIHPER